MITAWQSELKATVNDPTQLFKLLALSEDFLPAAQQAVKLFPLRVTQSFIARMRKGDPQDPLLNQVLPLGAEMLEVPGFSQDPLAESQHNPVPGLLHKYQGRVLLTVTGGCAIHCRYCFRRHFPYHKNTVGRKNWSQFLHYIAADDSIREVILSGGDPLVADDHHLSELITQLAMIPQLQILRIHSRLPIVLPQRINAELIQALTRTRLRPVMVIHCNHAQEIDETVAKALQMLVSSNITVLNQTVLLKTINDSLSALENLSYRLFNCHVLPYYLHLLDKVQGAAHFEVPMETAKKLYWQLRQRLPGYLVPTLVQEMPGATSKLPIL